jgi:tRNA (guanine6-N2)-methyltransferase
MPPVFALTTRGLEDVSLRELAALPGIAQVQSAYRRVTAAVDGDLAPLLALRTIDDVFLHLADWHPLSHTRAALADLKTLAASVDLTSAVEIIRLVRPVAVHPAFSLTANFVGKRNYSVPEIKQALRDGILSRCPHWRYVEDDAEAVLNVRLFIEHDRAVVGMRIGERPLYRRLYKQAHLPGSLKPTVAAALLMLAHAHAGQPLLDSFCGSGTILVEGALAGLKVTGGDLDGEAVRSARQNAKACISQWDATRLPLASHCFELAVSNLPWGRQVQVSSALEALYRRALDELRRVIIPGGKIVLLTSVPELLPVEQTVERREISLFGQNPTIVVLKT